MMKFKVGDKVVVKNDLVVDNRYEGFKFSDEMFGLKGKTLTITEIREGSSVLGINKHYKVKENGYSYTNSMLNPSNDYKHFESGISFKVNDDRTISFESSSLTEEHFTRRIQSGDKKALYVLIDDNDTYESATLKVDELHELRKFICEFDDYVQELSKGKEMTIDDIEKELGYKIKLK